jgi:hypothetical protein
VFARAVFASCDRAFNGASTAANSVVRVKKIVKIGSILIAEKNCKVFEANHYVPSRDVRARSQSAQQQVRAHDTHFAYARLILLIEIVCAALGESDS